MRPERLIAEALYPYPDDLVIATKGGLTRSGPNQGYPDGRPERLREACEGSLARLRLERIELYQLRRVDPEVAAGKIARSADRVARGGEDCAHRPVERLPRSAPPCPPAHADRLGPESLQPSSIGRTRTCSRNASAKGSLIEIPQGSRNKCEYDSELGGIKLDRFISASAVFPTDYGYVPETLAPDADPLDVLGASQSQLFPDASWPPSRSACSMVDEKGPDDHLLCVPYADPGWNTLEHIDELPALLLREISHFFTIYKDLDEVRCSEVKGWGTRDEALRTTDEAQQRFRRR